MSDSYEINIEDWHFRIQPPTDPASNSILVAIHGWTGNQYSMDIFTRKLKNEYWIIFPCAPYPAEGGGFSWIDSSEADQKNLQYLTNSTQNLHSRIDFLLHDHLHLIPNRMNLMGFSQGSAMALLYCLKYSVEGTKIGLLSGFLPDGLAAHPSNLSNRSFFIAHGKQDSVIPVEQAYRLASFIEDSGGAYDFCEANTGHKLSLDCFNRMQDFLS